MSDTEEKVPAADTISNAELDQIVDPDAGLSDAERAANVSPGCYTIWSHRRRGMANNH